MDPQIEFVVQQAAQAALAPVAQGLQRVLEFQAFSMVWNGASEEQRRAIVAAVVEKIAVDLPKSNYWAFETALVASPVMDALNEEPARAKIADALAAKAVEMITRSGEYHRQKVYDEIETRLVVVLRATVDNVLTERASEIEAAVAARLTDAIVDRAVRSRADELLRTLRDAATSKP